MSFRFVALLAVSVMIAHAFPGCGPGVKTGELEGTWLPASAELAGKVLPDKTRSTIRLVVEGNKYLVSVGKTVDQGALIINSRATPKELDIIGTDGPNKGKTIHAIFENDGELLRICYDLSGESRPREFRTTEGTQLFLVTYRKATPGDSGLGPER